MGLEPILDLETEIALPFCPSSKICFQHNSGFRTARGGVWLPSSDCSQAEDQSTAIDVTVYGLEFQGFRLGRVLGQNAHEVLGYCRFRILRKGTLLHFIAWAYVSCALMCCSLSFALEENDIFYSRAEVVVASYAGLSFAELMPDVSSCHKQTVKMGHLHVTKLRIMVKFTPWNFSQTKLRDRIANPRTPNGREVDYLLRWIWRRSKKIF